MNVYSANTPLLRSFTRRSQRSKIINVLFVVVANSISVLLWITTTRLEWFEAYYAPTAIEAWGDSLILLYVYGMQLLTLSMHNKHGLECPRKLAR